MFLGEKRMLKNKNIILATKPVYSYGLYWWRFLERLYKHSAISVQETFNTKEMLLFKHYIKFIMDNLEMDSAVKSVNIQVKKTLQTYQGLRLHLDLPVHGQWTRTNASTQWMLAHIPRRRHFLQRRNWWKFAINKDQKWFPYKGKPKEKINAK